MTSKVKCFCARVLLLWFLLGRFLKLRVWGLRLRVCVVRGLGMKVLDVGLRLQDVRSRVVRV